MTGPVLNNNNLYIQNICNASYMNINKPEINYNKKVNSPNIRSICLNLCNLLPRLGLSTVRASVCLESICPDVIVIPSKSDLTSTISKSHIYVLALDQNLDNCLITSGV